MATGTARSDAAEKGDGSGSPMLPSLFLVSLAICLVPVALVAIPALHDYPNHLTRLWLIAGGAQATPLSAIYAVDWSRATTNVGIDLLALAFGRLLSAELVGRIAVALALVLPIIGTAALGRAVMGRWHVGLLAIPALGWNLPLALGLLNNQIAIGVALLVAAAHARSPSGGIRRATLLFLGAIALCVIHPAGPVFLAGLLAALAIGRDLPRRAGFWPAFGAACRAAAVPLAAMLALYLLAPTHAGPEVGAGPPQPAWIYTAFFKAIAVVSPFLTYSLVAEGALGAFVLVGIYVGVRTGWLRIHAGLGLLAASLGLASLLLPSSIGDTGQMEFRLASMALFTLLAATAPARALSRRSMLAFAALALFVGAGRSLGVLSQWQAAARDIASVDRVLRDVPAGSSVLFVQAADDGPGAGFRSVNLAGRWVLHTHYGARAVVVAQAFVPTLFSAAQKQPLRVLAPWSRLSVPDGMTPLPGHLSHARDPRVAAAFPYLPDWRRDFDYVLLADAASPVAEPMPDGLEPVADAGFARLYRVRRDD